MTPLETTEAARLRAKEVEDTCTSISGFLIGYIDITLMPNHCSRPVGDFLLLPENAIIYIGARALAKGPIFGFPGVPRQATAENSIPTALGVNDLRRGLSELEQ
eukprot:CAMPEP_0198368534 /NCGR_PEP_ID=MMETSP1450-20131203/155750_1 /TAXON_ID=753684 ORGANISM="Madagascaria erythrocladiodes, Strain CCMP3234" /NCGR_SAMPLE_ID=MMETSP1450 /ASSEMBLY_ACC=CAM_ASM_001115 /LENGTH=103 /DNA_ID=CAMNT_0044076043 /DNA_START=538 /DNA_END=848 /DNA_ORIENTATION=-